MRKPKSARRPKLFLMFLLLSLVGWDTFPIHLRLGSIEAATDSPAKRINQLTPRAVANGKIAFEGWDADNNSNIFTINPDGSDSRQLTFDKEDFGPGWSPDGSKIVFIEFRREGAAFTDHSDIAVMNGDGSNQRLLTSSGQGEYNGYPAWSPDSSKIAFIRSRILPDFSKINEVYVINADGSSPRKVADGDGDFGFSGLYAFGPSWSPAGTQIAFTRNFNVYIIDADGGNERLILNGYDGPLWSPDGSKLAVVRPGGSGVNGAGIWLINVDGSNLTQIYKPIVPAEFVEVSDEGHVWSPDGSTIAFTEVYCRSSLCANDLGVSKAGVVNADGGNPTITQSIDNDSGILVIWSPDGTRILSTHYDLFTMNPDGSAVAKIANRVGDVSWQPLVPTPGPNTVQFSSSSYTVNEGDPSGHVNITLTRSGDTTSSASVNYATNDSAGLTNCTVFNGIASPRCDYENTQGTMNFAAGETSKSFSIAIVDDSYAEGTETFTVGLNSPSGATLGAQSTATVTITDNDATNGTNPIDNANFFVRQQYIDFLGREPDPPGFAGWTATINNCAPGDTTCDRIHVSQQFFQSAEFQDRGYFVYRFYPVAFGRKPDYSEFVPDLASVSGFLDANQLEAAKVAFIAAFMTRPAFVTAYNSLNNTQYVDALLNTAGVTLLPSPATRQALIDGLNNSTKTRGQVLRQIVESNEVSTKYNHQAYAVMEYFGYLRRQPDGFYLQWIQVLDQSNDPRGMVTGFVTSQEYRNRFGP